jgi:hypothetical protein
MAQPQQEDGQQQQQQQQQAVPETVPETLPPASSSSSSGGVDVEGGADTLTAVMLASGGNRELARLKLTVLVSAAPGMALASCSACPASQHNNLTLTL